MADSVVERTFEGSKWERYFGKSYGDTLDYMTDFPAYEKSARNFAGGMLRVPGGLTNLGYMGSRVVGNAMGMNLPDVDFNRAQADLFNTPQIQQADPGYELTGAAGEGLAGLAMGGPFGPWVAGIEMGTSMVGQIAEDKFGMTPVGRILLEMGLPLTVAGLVKGVQATGGHQIKKLLRESGTDIDTIQKLGYIPRTLGQRTDNLAARAQEIDLAKNPKMINKIVTFTRNQFDSAKKQLQSMVGKPSAKVSIQDLGTRAIKGIERKRNALQKVKDRLSQDYNVLKGDTDAVVEGQNVLDAFKSMIKEYNTAGRTPANQAVVRQLKADRSAFMKALKRSGGQDTPGLSPAEVRNWLDYFGQNARFGDDVAPGSSTGIARNLRASMNKDLAAAADKGSVAARKLMETQGKWQKVTDSLYELDNTFRAPFYEINSAGKPVLKDATQVFKEMSQLPPENRLRLVEMISSNDKAFWNDFRKRYFQEKYLPSMEHYPSTISEFNPYNFLQEFAKESPTSDLEMRLLFPDPVERERFAKQMIEVKDEIRQLLGSGSVQDNETLHKELAGGISAYLTGQAGATQTARGAWGWLQNIIQSPERVWNALYGQGTDGTTFIERLSTQFEKDVISGGKRLAGASLVKEAGTAGIQEPEQPEPEQKPSQGTFWWTELPGPDDPPIDEQATPEPQPEAEKQGTFWWTQLPGPDDPPVE